MMFGEKGGKMPGPAMASRMMQMMPMMAGQMLSECAGEDRAEYLAEMVCRMVTQGTEGMTDEEYQSLVETISEQLRKRDPAHEKGSGSCC